MAESRTRKGMSALLDVSGYILRSLTFYLARCHKKEYNEPWIFPQFCKVLYEIAENIVLFLREYTMIV